MNFSLIDFGNWSRREYYLHFINEVRCTYSTCVNIDITNIKKYKLYPTMLWLLTFAVCDGYHIGQLTAILQEKTDSFAE